MRLSRFFSNSMIHRRTYEQEVHISQSKSNSRSETGYPKNQGQLERRYKAVTPEEKAERGLAEVRAAIGIAAQFRF